MHCRKGHDSVTLRQERQGRDIIVRGGSRVRAAPMQSLVSHQKKSERVGEGSLGVVSTEETLCTNFRKDCLSQGSL